MKCNVKNVSNQYKKVETAQLIAESPFQKRSKTTPKTTTNKKPEYILLIFRLINDDIVTPAGLEPTTFRTGI
jgi:hypothetical protein